MKILFSLLAFTALSLHSFATEWLTYYVYVETEYVQGPWTRAAMLESSGNRYLAVEAYEDLFGSGDAQLVETLLARLKKKKPDVYAWTWDLTFNGDTVVIRTKDAVKNAETVKNEITATLTSNNFSAVTFNMSGTSETWTKQDLTLSYLDLVSVQAPAAVAPVKSREPAVQVQTEPTSAEKKDAWKIGCLVSMALNLVLAVLLLRKRTRK